MRKRKNGLVLLDEDDEEPQFDTPHATLAAFLYADSKPATTDCLLREARGWPNLVYCRIGNDALIDRSRSRMASEFLRSKRELTGDVLLMIDHDMQWQTDDLKDLARKVLETKGIVAGVYSKRQFGGGVAVRFGAPGEYTTGQDVLAPAQYVSAGFMGIHREALEKMSEDLPFTIGNFWPFFMPIIEERKDGTFEELSEDWSACLRARAKGVPIYAYMKPRLRHCGEHDYRVVDSQSAPPPEQDVTFKVAEDVQVPAIQELLKDTSDYADISLDSIHHAIGEGRQGLASLWHKAGSFDPSVEDAWYRREDVGRHYILDLVGWHFINIGPLLANELGSIKGGRVLDFGSGIGTMSLMLAQQGCEVDMVEVNPELRKFTEYRMERHLNGKRAMRFVDAPEGSYDMAICWHVFEHLPEPEKALASIVDALKPGGLLFSQSDWHKDAVHPMHHERDDSEWEKAMREAGLVAVKPNWYRKEAG